MKRNLILIFCVLLGLAWFTAISDAINNPKKAQEHLAKARELESQGIYVDAITEYEEALEYWPQDVEISLEMANAYLHTGRENLQRNIPKMNMPGDGSWNSGEAMRSFSAIMRSLGASGITV